MKKLLNIAAMLIVMAVAFIATLNVNKFFDFTVWGTAGVNDVTYNLNFIYILLGLFVAGFLAGAAWVGSYLCHLQEKFKEYKRKLEQTTVSAESDSSRVEVLKAKIEVLEKALKSALEKNQ